MKKAIFINPETQTVSEVNLTNQLKETYSLIGCNLVEGAINFGRNDLLVVDEEGMFNEGKCGFFIDGVFLYGNAVVWGADNEGEADDVKITCKEVYAQIKWCNAEESQRIRENILNQQPMVFYW
jgi:hypothetical protein